MNEEPGNFLARLKQHHLYGVVVYAVVAGFLIQLASRVLPAFGWGGAFTAAIIILLAGFPVAVMLAWTFIKPKDPARYTRWQNIHWKLHATMSAVVVAAAVISGFYVWRWNQHHAARLIAEQAEPRASAKPATPAFTPHADSIVVLPFTNLSGDPKQAYFSNGITEELTDALGRNTSLTVIAWETASRYSGGKETPAEIGKALNVAQLLGGSIEHEGNAVRVSVELVSTITGEQLWSAHYDDSFRNIFLVQDKISAAIADTLKVKFAGLRAAPTRNPRAHELYLKGLAALDRFSTADVQAAQEDFHLALRLDPNYADPWAGLAYSYLLLSEITTLPLKEALPKARAAAEKALALDPRNINALVQLGNADFDDDRIAGAKQEYQQALMLDPSNAAAHHDYGYVLPLAPGLAQFQQAVRLNPDSAPAQESLAGDYLDLADWSREVVAARALKKLPPHDIDAAFDLAFTYTQMQRGEDAVKAFDLVQPSGAIDWQVLDAGRQTYQALLKPVLRPKALAALDRLRRARISPLAQADLLQLYLALGKREIAMQILPGNCAAYPFGCDDLAVNPIYASPHGNPRFEKLASQYTTVSPGTAPAAAAFH